MFTPVVGLPVIAAPAVSAPVAAAPAPAIAASAPVAAPVVLPIVLPVADLSALAANAGLQWVQSDTQKVASVQAAIAAEPAAPRVPRERPAPVVSDDGPLVLVETQRDLRDLKLPFDTVADAGADTRHAS